MTRIEKIRRPVRSTRAQGRSNDARVTVRLRGPAGTRVMLPSATLEQLIEKHRERILLAATACDAGDLEGAIVEGVHGLMDAMSQGASGSRRALDALCASAIERRVADYCARMSEQPAA